MSFLEAIGLGHYKIHTLLDPNDERMGMRHLRRGPVCLTIRTLQGLKGLLLNWDLDLGRLSLSLCWWRPHKLGIGWHIPEWTNPRTWDVLSPYLSEWSWYLGIPGGSLGSKLAR